MFNGKIQNYLYSINPIVKTHLENYFGENMSKKDLGIEVMSSLSLETMDLFLTI